MAKPTLSLIVNPTFQPKKAVKVDPIGYNRIYHHAIKKRWHILQHALQQRVRYLLDLWRQAWQLNMADTFLAKIDTERNCIDFLLEKVANPCTDCACICTSIARLHQQFEAHTRQVAKAVERRKYQANMA